MPNRQATRKSVLSRLGALSPNQRLSLNDLRNQGIPEAEARAIVQGYSAVGKARDPINPGRLVQRRAIVNLLGANLTGKATKTAVLGSEAHVPVPLGSDGKKKQRVFAVAKDWSEQDHPRADNGQFGSGGGGGGGGKDKPSSSGGGRKKPTSGQSKAASKAAAQAGAKADASGTAEDHKAAASAHAKAAKMLAASGDQSGRAEVHAMQARGHQEEARAADKPAREATAAAYAAADKADRTGSADDHKAAAKAHAKAAKINAGNKGNSREGVAELHNMHAQGHKDAAKQANAPARKASAAAYRASAKADASGSAADHAAAVKAHQKAMSINAKSGSSREGVAELHSMHAQGHASFSKSGVGKSLRQKKKGEGFAVNKAALSAEEMALIKASQLQVPTEAPVPGDIPPELEPLVQANRLVAGMDAEFDAGAQGADDARRRASRALVERAGFYDAVGVPDEVRQLKGLLLDVGCGPNRRKGWLGVDLYPWDHGVMIQDAELGIPLPDASCRAINLTDALHPIIDGIGGSGDPIPLLTECQRLLCEGGRLYYSGPEPLWEANSRWPLPGLIVVRGDGEVTQEFERVPLRVPAYHGADPTFAPAGPLPLDVQMALAAYNSAPAETAMANLISKDAPQLTRTMKTRLRKSLGERKRVRVVKADKYRQIVLGVVLEPHTVDSQGDMMTPEDIEASAHAWLASSRVIGSEHGKPIEATPVESYIAPIDFTLGGELVIKGSWLMGTKIHDEAEWKKVLDGEYEGYSVGGFGERE